MKSATARTRKAPVKDKLDIPKGNIPLGRLVVCAAMLMRDKTIIVGIRHFSPEMRETMHRICGDGYHLKVAKQGFVDQRGVFLSRKAAWRVADAARQIRRQTGSAGTLYSEDLY